LSADRAAGRLGREGVVGETRKALIVNGDDFGFTRDVNAGIVEAHQRGILRATTLMANGAAFEDAVQLARATPGLDVGCHLVLVRGGSVADPACALPSSVAELLRAIALRRFRVYEELHAQVRRILEAGIQPSHLDTHKHTHLLPPVLEAVARVAAEFGIRWVRRPFQVPLLRRRCRATLDRYGCRTTDHFAGFRLTGRLDARELAALIRRLPAGVTELMCHPGRCTEELRAAYTRLKQSRQIELDALTAPEVREAIEQAGVRLVSFREL
jgi:predicted glycoside hydrolase/deacetylase ChbG (UPF0249 family)